MSFTAPKFTGAGRQLHTRVLAGDTLTFTTIKLGDGTMTTEPIAALTDLIHGIITLPVHEVRRNADYADVTGVFQNAGLQSGFYWREIGIFAADPDYPDDRSHDVLYCYQNAAELAEYIPSASSAVIEKIIRVACVVGDAENVTVGLASQAYAKAEDLQALEEQHSKDVERIDDALNAVDPTKVIAKAAPADTDGVMIADSADGGKAKRLLWSSVKAALNKLFVPLARKINGKALSSDVTLSASDIKMPDSDEDVGTAMAKRLGRYTLMWAEDAVPDTVSAINQIEPGCYGFVLHKRKDWLPDELGDKLARYELIVHNTTAGTQNGTLHLRCIDGTYKLMEYIGEIVIKAEGISIRWVRVATYTSPEIHELPLADSINRLGTAAYWKNAFNEVTVVFDYGEKSNGNFAPDQWTLVATLPEGFRPVLQSQWGMCSDSGSDNVVATYRLDYDGSLYYRASTAAVNKKSLGSIRFVFIARVFMVN